MSIDLQIQSKPCELKLNIYTAETIERVVCNGEDLEIRQLGVSLYFTEMKGRDDS